MNLVEVVIRNSRLVEGIDNDKLKDILLGNDKYISVVTAKNSVIILSNKKIIKCIEKYYKTTDDQLLKKTGTSNFCYQNLVTCGNTCGVYNCVQCHLDCIEKVENDQLKMK